MMNLLNAFIMYYVASHTLTHDPKKSNIDSRWVRKEGRLVKQPSASMSESVNEGSRMDQIEATMAKMAEHLLTLAANASNNAAPRAAGGSENERQEEPPIGMNDEAPAFDDDLAEYATGRMAGTQAEM